MRAFSAAVQSLSAAEQSSALFLGLGFAALLLVFRVLVTRTGYVSYATWRLRRRSTIFTDAQSTMRSEGDFIVSSERGL